MIQKVIIDDNSKNSRLDHFIANIFPEYSRAALVKLIDKESIKINGELQKPGYRLKTGDKLHIDTSLLEQIEPDINMPVIYEDEDVLVVNKPHGVISHARGRFWNEASVASFIRSRVANLTGERAGIVHRLDRATSGVMICAKNASALAYLQKQFSNRSVHKSYIAVCEGKLKHKKAIIDAPIARNPKRPTTFRVSNDGKPAITEYEVVKEGTDRSLVRLTPKTGRTHQLRVHTAYIGNPVVGDVYYNKNADKEDRLLLHAESLEIVLPSGIRRQFKASLPKEFHA